VNWTGQRDVEQRNPMLLACRRHAATSPVAVVTVEVHCHDLDRDTDQSGREGELGPVLERLAERPQLLSLSLGVDDYLLNELIDCVTHGEDPIPRPRQSLSSLLDGPLDLRDP